MSKGTPEEVLKSIVDGINAGNLEAVMPLYETGLPLRLSLGASVTAYRGSVKQWPVSLR